MRSETITLRLCPRCGATYPSCGCRHADTEQPREVLEAITLLRSVAPFLARQPTENEVGWLNRVMDLVGHVHISLEDGILP